MLKISVVKPPPRPVMSIHRPFVLSPELRARFRNGIV